MHAHTHTHTHRIEHSGYFAPTFAKHGIITVAIGYDLAPKGNDALHGYLLVAMVI